MNDLITKVKRCSRKENCIHPAQVLDGWLPATQECFHKNSNYEDGLMHWCKECVKMKNKKWYNKNKEETQRKGREYYQEHKKEIRESGRAIYFANRDYYLRYAKEYRQGHSEKIREYAKDYRTTQKDKFRSSIENWKKQHPEIIRFYGRQQNFIRRSRLKQAQGKFSKQDIDNKYHSQNSQCFWCHCDLHGTYHIDHYIPLARGGSNFPSNIVISCPRCNLSRGDKLAEEWTPITLLTD